MSALLETIADRTATHAMDLASIVEVDLRDLKAAPDSRRLQMEVAAAQLIETLLASLADILTEWKADAQNLLRRGLSGHDFRPLVAFGERLSEEAVSGVERVKRMWDTLGEIGASPADVEAGRSRLSVTEDRVQAIKKWTDHLARLARRRPPDIDPALIEAGADAIRQGRFKTTTQILELLRNQST